MTTLLLLAFLSSPAEARKRQLIAPPPTPPIVAPADPVAPPTDGSLWNDVVARQLAGMDGNARRVGDLITVLVDESTATQLTASTGTKSSSGQDRKINALFGVESTLTAAHPSMGGEIGIGTSSTATFDGAGATSRDAAIVTTLTCKVIEVLPNGNLRVWGYKQLRVNRENQYVVLQGEVRPKDVQMDNTVRSDLVAEARIEVTGAGVVADKQGPGLLARVLDALWPF